jgi:hypothetical protein
MNEIERKVQNDMKQLVDGSLTEKERISFEKQFKQEAKKLSSEIDVLKALAFTRQELFMKEGYQTLAYLDLTTFSTEKKKIEYYDAGKKEKYNKELAEKERLVREKFKDTVIDRIKLEMYHKDLERRLGFIFQLGQNDYMTAYLSCLIRSD